MKSFGKLFIIAVILGIIGFLLAINFYENKLLYIISCILVLPSFIIFTWGKFFGKIQPFRLSITLAIIAVLLAVSVTYIIHWLKIVTDVQTEIVMIIAFYTISNILYAKNELIERMLNKFLNKFLLK